MIEPMEKPEPDEKEYRAWQEKAALSQVPAQCTCSVETNVNNATDFAIIDAAARAWIDAGGDADGVTYNWHHIRDRVGELD